MYFEFYDPAEYYPDEPVAPRKGFGKLHVQDPRTGVILAIQNNSFSSNSDVAAYAESLTRAVMRRSQ